MGILAALCGSLPALAWGPEGHDLVARIAEAQLTPAAKARVAEILGPNATMASISSWADQVRRQRSESAPWHYVDIPIDKPRFDRARDCARDACVVAQIEADEAALRNPATPAAQRRESLLFLIHFVGDMHQPLHSSDNKDKGGNDVHVTAFEWHGNLHSTWDGFLLGRIGKEDELFPVLLKDAEKHAKKWSKGNPEQWANESHKEAQKIVYGKLPKPPAGGNIALGTDYEKAADPVIRVQIEKAGDRLARVLNEVLQ
ncbi:MAG TPA: S1/P1 nuclease [Candidatus Sulfopaludibacter sp.]|nr:S1/P1 nuclease [Candidatus Sulfopaludibacter sp.]